MKFFVFATLIAAASAVPSLVNTGNSAVSRSDDGHGNYQFGYNEDHATGGTFRKEQGGPGYQTGSYGLRDADGRVRTVNYVADAHGYRASVSTNEPGTDVKQDPAAADFNYGGEGYSSSILSAPIVASADNYGDSYGADLGSKGYGGSLGAVAYGGAALGGADLGGKGYGGSLGGLAYGGASLGGLGGLGGSKGYGGSLGAVAYGGASLGGLGGYGSSLGGLGYGDASLGGLSYGGNLGAASYGGASLGDHGAPAYTEAAVSFPSSYSVSTQHSTYAPALHQSAGSVLAGNDYGNYGGDFNGALGNIGGAGNLYGGSGKY